MNPKITMYSTVLCPYCRAAKAFFDEQGWQYEDIRVDLQPRLRIEMMEKANGRHTVPQIWINGTHVGGYTDMVAMERSGELDSILQSNSD